MSWITRSCRTGVVLPPAILGAIMLAGMVGRLDSSAGALLAEQEAACGHRFDEAPVSQSYRGGRGLPRHGIRSVRLCRYFGTSSFGTPVGGKSRREVFAAERVVMSNHVARLLVLEVNALSQYPGAGTELQCPPETGASMYAEFVYASHVSIPVRVRFTGCASVEVGSRRPLFQLSKRLADRLRALAPIK
jgi:hypothetical protein